LRLKNPIRCLKDSTFPPALIIEERANYRVVEHYPNSKIYNRDLPFAESYGPELKFIGGIIDAGIDLEFGSQSHPN
jgi:hypothetical protein